MELDSGQIRSENYDNFKDVRRYLAVASFQHLLGVGSEPTLHSVHSIVPFFKFPFVNLTKAVFLCLVEKKIEWGTFSSEAC